MSEKDETKQAASCVASGEQQGKSSGPSGGASGAHAAKPSREDRLAEALRANLRRRKSAAKTRKDG